MRHSKALGSLLLVALLVVGTVAPAAAMATPATPADQSGASQVNQSALSTVPANNTTNETDTNVTVGQQLSTVISVTGDEVQTEFENSAFEAEFEGSNESKQAEAIAERAEELREKAKSIREDYREATEAYRAGEIRKSQYAQRLAVLNSRAENLLSSYRMLQERATNVSALELRAAGFNRTALEQSTQSLDNVTGAGPSALLQRYTGQTTGEFEIETKNGLTVAVESEDGERSVEIERPRDDNSSVTISQSAALQTARSALGPAPDNGTWALTESSIHADSGYYKFGFALKQANVTGEAEVRVDGSTGEVFRLEQEVEPASEREEEEREPGERGEDETEGRELALLVAAGTPAPGETITVQALSAGEPAGNATVYVDDRAVGTTDANGTISVTLPNESATVKAVSGEQEAELEFEFEREEEDVYRDLNVSGSADNGTVTISVIYNGTPVQNAAVFANGEQVGTTGADGTVTFATNATDELEVEVVKGEFEAELVFSMVDSSLTLTTEAHEGDGDKDSDEREEETDETESDEDADEKTTTSDSDQETDEETDDETTTTEDDEETEDEDETTAEEDSDEDETTTTES